MRTVFFELNGHPREVQVFDKGLGIERSVRPKADKDNLHHLGAPMPGTVIDVKVSPGDEVKEGDKLVVLEAMKMEMTVASPLAGVIKDVSVKAKDRVDSQDLLIVFK
jgi:pyruvate carboxylase